VRIAAATSLLLLALALGNAAEAEEARLPRPRPATTPTAALADWAADAGARFAAARAAPTEDAAGAIDMFAPLPRPRPPDPPELLAMVAPDAEPAPQPVTPLPAATETEAEFAACLGDLRALGVEFELADPIEGDCPILRPLNVTALGQGVAVAPDALLNCATTRALAEWVRDVALPAGASALGVKPTLIRHGSAYVCRNRNNDPEAKLSEHARANAVDIVAFEFDDRAPIGVGVNSVATPEAAFEAAARAGACRYFTTVIGPGSNDAHATHFHFDLMERRGGYRLCELGAPESIARAPENTKRE
jgi:hypothetical protein